MNFQKLVKIWMMLNTEDTICLDSIFYGHKVYDAYTKSDPEKILDFSRSYLERGFDWAVHGEDLVFLKPEFFWNYEKQSWDLKFEPSHLLSALWFQFGMAVRGGLDFKNCPECSKWFEVSPGSGRPDKHFCSNACRMRAYRRRKASGQ